MVLKNGIPKKQELAQAQNKVCLLSAYNFGASQ
jgi:hypothetical protein